MGINNGVYTASKTMQRRAWLRCVLLLPVYLFSLTYDLTAVLAFHTDTWLRSFAALTINAAAVCILLVTFSLDYLVARFKLHPWFSKIDETLMLAILVVAPLFSTAAFAWHVWLAPESDLFLYVSSLVMVPFGILLSYGCYKGVRDPFMHAAFKDQMQQHKNKARRR